jgi:hypothetical protein
MPVSTIPRGGLFHIDTSGLDHESAWFDGPTEICRGTVGAYPLCHIWRPQVRWQKPTTRVVCSTTRVVSYGGKIKRGRYTPPLERPWLDRAEPEVPAPRSEHRPEGGKRVRSVDVDPSSVDPSREYRRRGEALDALANQRRQREGVEVGIRRTVAKARSLGVTWAEIGTMLGVTQQAASKRYGRG